MHIVIVGGGAAGLACLQAILETGEYRSSNWTVSLYEERNNIGGIW